MLSRSLKESIVIGDNIRVHVIKISRGSVCLGVDAPRQIPVHRQEVFEVIERNREPLSIEIGDNVETLEITENANAEASVTDPNSAVAKLNQLAARLVRAESVQKSGFGVNEREWAAMHLLMENISELVCNCPCAS